MDRCHTETVIEPSARADDVPDLSVLVVGYQSRDDLRGCLSTLLGQADGQALEVVVVDNASSDGTVAMLGAEFPAVRAIRLEENVGFARAVNLAARNARGRNLMLLNPDTRMVNGTTQALLRFAAEHPQHGIYGGRTLTPEGDLEPTSCWAVPTLWSTLLFATGLTTAFPRTRLDPESIPGWNRDSVREVGVVTGCLLLAPRAVWDRLGGFDPDFFMYGEDVDLALRARAHGYRPVIVPDACVEHEVGASSSFHGSKNVMLLKGKVTLMRKHWSPLRRDTGILLLLAGTALRAMLSTIRGGDLARPGEPSSWRHAFARRREWRYGWEPHTD
jgi:N-acetylglucosaminyl-diphospho-decaprenol L-rhamnosyltransferase